MSGGDREARQHPVDAHAGIRSTACPVGREFHHAPTRPRTGRRQEDRLDEAAGAGRDPPERTEQQGEDRQAERVAGRQRRLSGPRRSGRRPAAAARPCMSRKRRGRGGPRSRERRRRSSSNPRPGSRLHPVISPPRRRRSASSISSRRHLHRHEPGLRGGREHVREGLRAESPPSKALLGLRHASSIAPRRRPAARSAAGEPTALGDDLAGPRRSYRPRSRRAPRPSFSSSAGDLARLRLDHLIAHHEAHR